MGRLLGQISLFPVLVRGFGNKGSDFTGRASVGKLGVDSSRCLVYHQ